MLKKALLLLFLGVIFGICKQGAYAQDKQVVQSSYEISDVKLTNIPRITGLIGTAAPTISTATIPQAAEQPSNDWRIELRLKNLTGKTFAKVRWQIKTEASSDQTSVIVFEDKAKIKPGKTAKVSESFKRDPKELPADSNLTIEVKRIEFEDGSMWEPPKDP